MYNLDVWGILKLLKRGKGMKEVFGDSVELIGWLSEKEAYDYYAKEFK